MKRIDFRKIIIAFTWKGKRTKGKGVKERKIKKVKLTRGKKERKNKEGKLGKGKEGRKSCLNFHFLNQNQISGKYYQP